MTVRLIEGDALARLAELPAESIDACISDPPSGISFMGAKWDHDKGGRREWVAWLTSVFEEVHRVLKPGAHGLVWALPRQAHWTAWALEDAGFTVRDKVYHLTGQGFPKSLDISKQIDKAAGAERSVVGRNPLSAKQTGQAGTTSHGDRQANDIITAPATPEAVQWEGWGTALKPAAEEWILIRKPLSEKTVAANVLAHGTGGLNIDATRIAGIAEKPGSIRDKRHFDGHENGYTLIAPPEPHAAGRWPSHLVLSHEPECREVGTKRVKTSVNAKFQPVKTSRGHQGGSFGNADARQPEGHERSERVTPQYADDDGTETVSAWECSVSCAVRMLDEQSGERKSVRSARGGTSGNQVYGQFGEPTRYECGYTDTGGASRFFATFSGERFLYCSKPSSAERGSFNSHPTVKSLALMKWLVRLVTPPGGTILDPFCGSGSTLIAADREGFSAVGIDSDAHAIEIAQRRLSADGGLFSEVEVTHG